jgi:hypothetical protein
MIAEKPSPESSVCLRGATTLYPKTCFLPAYFHQPITVIKSHMEVAVAITVEGSKANPDTGFPPESNPEVTALVRPL